MGNRQQELMEERIALLLTGAIDLHTHTAPSLSPRSVDSWDLLERAASAGMRGVLIKDHHFTTAPQAWLVNRHAATQDCRLFSAICLNHATGGLNPAAVEAAVRFGVDLVCLPTLSAANHEAYKEEVARTVSSIGPSGGDAPGESGTASGIEFPGYAPPRSAPDWKEAVPVPEPIRLLDGQGRLNPEVRTILRMVAAADIVIATGHCGAEEAVAVMRAAREEGCRKILLTHLPSYTTSTTSDLLQIADSGPCYVELSWEMTVRDLPESYRFTPLQIAGYIRAFGPERVVLSSDYGHARLPDPVEGMRETLRMLIAEGFDDDQIRTMTARNPALLMERRQSDD